MMHNMQSRMTKNDEGNMDIFKRTWIEFTYETNWIVTTMF